MSNNVDHVAVLSGSLTIISDGVDEDDMPEDGFPTDVGTILDKSNFSWRGEGSGRSVDTLIEILETCCEGEMEFILEYESGDKEGYRVKDGRVTALKVKMALE